MSERRCPPSLFAEQEGELPKRVSRSWMPDLEQIVKSLDDIQLEMKDYHKKVYHWRNALVSLANDVRAHKDAEESER